MMKPKAYLLKKHWSQHSLSTRVSSLSTCPAECRSRYSLYHEADSRKRIERHYRRRQRAISIKKKRSRCYRSTNVLRSFWRSVMQFHTRMLERSSIVISSRRTSCLGLLVKYMSWIGDCSSSRNASCRRGCFGHHGIYGSRAGLWRVWKNIPKERPVFFGLILQELVTFRKGFLKASEDVFRARRGQTAHIIHFSQNTHPAEAHRHHRKEYRYRAVWSAWQCRWSCWGYTTIFTGRSCFKSLAWSTYGETEALVVSSPNACDFHYGCTHHYCIGEQSLSRSCSAAARTSASSSKKQNKEAQRQKKNRWELQNAV